MENDENLKDDPVISTYQYPSQETVEKDLDYYDLVLRKQDAGTEWLK